MKLFAIRKYKFYAIINLIFLILPSQLALNHPWQPVVNLGVAFFVACGVLLTFSQSSSIPRRALSFILIAFLLLAAAFLSAFQNGWVRPVLAYGGFIGVFIICLMLFSKINNYTNFVIYIVIGSVLTGLTLTVIGLFTEPFSLYRYQGIFNNPNNMGWFSAAMSALIIGALYENRLEWKSRQKFFLWSALGINLMLLLACNSRAALGAVISVFLLLMLVQLRNAISLSRIRLRSLRYILSSFVLLSIFVFFTHLAGFLDPVVEKFVLKASAGNVLGNRLEAWTASLSHWTLFGLGPDYALLIGREGETTGHNSFISQLSRYGLIPAILFFGLLFSIWYQAYNALKSHASRIAPVLAATVTAFVVNSIFETGASTPGVWLSIVLYGAFIAEKRFARI